MNKMTVTIGIPAHNEEKNIKALLRGILAQFRGNFVIKSIIVLCDGCTDDTVKIAENIAQTNKIIKVINDGNHKGKSTRLNQLYEMTESDILISFDADVKLGHKNVINELVKHFANP